MKRYGFYLNLEGCTGCKACQITCKDKNDLPAGILWRKVVEVQGGEWVKHNNLWVDNTITYFTSVACMHCERPICMEVCPANAISQREDGIVLIDSGRCVGCRYCEMACPYSALQYNQTTGTMSKCDFCVDELDRGGKPACVSACQMRVLVFDDIEILRENFGVQDGIYPLPPPNLTEPAVTYTPHRDSVPHDNRSTFIGNLEEIYDESR